MMDAFGAGSLDFVNGLLTQLAEALPRNGRAEDDLNFMLAVVREIRPRSQVEAMLAAQMASIHVIAMRFANYLANAENLHQIDSYERAINKLTRTFIGQMEALRRYRAAGEEKAAEPLTSSLPTDNAAADKSAEAKTGPDLQSTASTGAKVVPMKRKAAG
jgi:hypothetical protein